jgi:NADPH2:quinone reductase
MNNFKNMKEMTKMPRRLELVSLTKGTDVSSLRDALKLVNFEPPPLAPGKVRVKILFAALNFADLLIAQGEYQEKPPLPAVLGSEASGIIVQSSVDTLPAGTSVLAIVPGTFGSFVDADISQVFPIGQRFPLEFAAGFGVAAGTAHLGLVDRGKAVAGDVVVVTGASGGTGMYACLIAKAIGCKVVSSYPRVYRL